MAWFSKDSMSVEEWDTSDFNSGGYTSTGEDGESYLSDTENEDLDALINQGDTTDVYGQTFDYTQTNTEDPFVTIGENGTKANILGLPLNFCKTADPGGRVYKDTIFQDLPYVFILPGKPVLNSKLVDVNNEKISKGKVHELIEAMENPNKMAVRGARHGADMRFMSFRSDYSNYFSYVEVMLSAIHASMGLSGIYDFQNDFDTTFKQHGLCFYADKSTSVSESANNDYTESSIVQKANDLSSVSRELKAIVGINSNIKDFESSDVDSLVDSMTSSNGIFDRIGGALGRVVNGSQLLYPEIWADSNFDKSYSINFKFYSPYGDKDSIFKYVYVPFVSLLALALPRQDSLMGYGQPFVLRLCSPGWFESSMAVVSSMSFVKGGSDSLWTIDGLPQEIEVTLNIKDLYPTIAQTKKYSMLSYNLGLASYLDTMAGIRTDQLDIVLKAESWAKRFLSTPSRIKNKIGNTLSDFAYEIQSGINNFLR